VHVKINGTHISGPNEDTARYVLHINTVDYRDDPSQPNSANRIRVDVQEKADVYFMRLFGFENLPVAAHAIAENISDLDVALIFDKSGSMEFDTLCYGCWTPKSGVAYPDGDLWPLPWGGPPNGLPTHCQGEGNDPPWVYDNKNYIVIEGEDYSRLSNPYARNQTDLGQTYWVLGRNNDYPNNTTPGYMKSGGGAKALGRDGRGGYISHHPPRTSINADGTGVPCYWNDLQSPGPSGYPFPEYRMCSRSSWVMSRGGPFPAPRADYDFTVPENGTWYLWVRGQGGSGDEGDELFWGLSGGAFGSYDLIGRGKDFRNDGYYNGADGNKWSWRRMGCGNNDSQPCGQTLQPGTDYTLHLWAGAPSFDVDRIIITDDPDNPKYLDGTDDRWDDVLHNTDPAVFDDNRTDWACYTCDARYGGYPTGPGYDQPPQCTSSQVPQPHRYLDDIYDDEQPIRDAVEAAKRFVLRLNPSFDQIGYVAYSSSASIESELQCVRRLGADNCTLDVIESELVSEIDSTHAGGGTNIAHGIVQGIKVLSNKPGHYGRPGAAHIMIVMTDGQANQTRNLDPACYAEDYWPKNSGQNNYDRAKDCVVYYAMDARNNGVVIYSITLGATADIELMQHIAEMTGGMHRHAPSAEQLDPIFDELYSRIFLRLVE
jgi:hypothetical protein